MNKLIVPFILIALGVIVVVTGLRRSDSVAGVSDTLGAKIANTWDGDARQPKHVWFYVGGGALIVAGIAVAVRKTPGV